MQAFQAKSVRVAGTLMGNGRFMPPRRSMTAEEAEALAVAAFSSIAADDERLMRFLELAGIRPDQVRAAAAEPGFLAGVLDHVAADEALLVDLAKAMATSPERIMQARAVLSPTLE